MVKPISMNNKTKKHFCNCAPWIPIGIGIGVAMGVAMNSIAIGTALGAAFGIVMTLVTAKKTN